VLAAGRPVLGTMKALRNVGDAEGEWMLSNGKELLGELYGRDHPTSEEIEDLELTVVTENGESVSAEELRDKIFRIVDRENRAATW
jgi:hypothetical protein